MSKRHIGYLDSGVLSDWRCGVAPARDKAEARFYGSRLGSR